MSPRRCSVPDHDSQEDKMRRSLAPLVFLATSLAAAPAFAGARTISLAMANMYCASCPYIVKQSLARVPGVSAVSVSFEEKRATVTYDDRKTSPAALVT